MMIIIWAGLGVLGLMTVLWLISIYLKNVSIVDNFWGIGFILITFIYYLQSEVAYTRLNLVMLLVSLWGLRLSVYLMYRNYGKEEDYRYREFRRSYGPKRYWWFSFFQVFMLQGGLMMIISMPLLGVALKTNSDALNLFDYLGILIWSIGFIFESVGDYQLASFKRHPQNKGKLLTTGLWRYTRHPNYFGDTAIWWGFGLFAIASGAYWYSLGSLLMTYLIIKISGVAMLEKSLSEVKPGYEQYVETTSTFFPWFPKQRS
jgi:steroid 5-alpha reductase family enzyme